MDVNYILIKGNKHFKCHSLAEMAIYFSLSVTSNGSVICDGYHDTMSYSKEWSHEDIIVGYTEYMCSYVRNHQTGMKWGRLINIKRKKTCNRKEIQ